MADLTQDVKAILSGSKVTEADVKEAKKKLDLIEKQILENQEKLAAVTLRDSTLDVNNSAAVDHFLWGLQNQGLSFQDQRQALTDKVRHAHLLGIRLNLRHTTISEELKYWRDSGENRDRNHDMKALQSIPAFNGGSESQWRAFEHPWLVAIRNRNITEQDLLTALYQKLQGSAATFYLSLDAIETMTFGEVMEKLRKKYTTDPLTAMNKIQSLTQLPKESVEDYAARMIVEGKGLQPSTPGELKVLVTMDKCYIIPNPMKKEEMEVYPREVATSRSLLSPAFLRNMKPDIASRLPSERYTEFDQLVEAAKKAEWMKNSISTGMIHAIDVDCSVNAVGNESKGHFQGKQGEKKGDCFNCGKPGHWASECKDAPASSGKPFGAFNPRPFRKPAVWRGGRRTGGVSSRGRGSFKRSPRNKMSWNPREPGRRRWMVQHRAGLNRKLRHRHQVHALGVEVEENYTEEDIELAHLEEELEQDAEEFEQYQREVEEFENQLEMTEESKN